jgi:hypothetical protein
LRTKKGLCAARKESSTSVTRHRSQKKPTRRRTNQQLEVEAAKNNKKNKPPQTDARAETGFATTTKTRITPPLAGFFLPANSPRAR